MTDLELMRQALAALDGYARNCRCEGGGAPCDAAEALRARLAQPEPEPVAWQVHPFDYGIGPEGVYARTDRLEQVEMWKRKGWTVQPLYTHPQPAAQWVGLTDDDYQELLEVREWGVYLIEAVEAKLKEKNT